MVFAVFVDLRPRKQLNTFLSDHGGFEATLVKVNGEPFKIARAADCDDNIESHKTRLLEVGKAIGLDNPCITVEEYEESIEC